MEKTITLIFSELSFIVHLVNHPTSVSRSSCSSCAARATFLLLANMPVSSEICNLDCDGFLIRHVFDVDQ